MILETQQSSDTTYRVYDYDRADDNGNTRELHIQQSLDVTTIPHIDPKLEITQLNENQSSVTTFIESDYFDVFEWNVDGILDIKSNAPYTLASVIEGFGYLKIGANQTYELSKGMHFIIPNDIDTWVLEGDMDIIASEPGKRIDNKKDIMLQNQHDVFSFIIIIL